MDPHKTIPRHKRRTETDSSSWIVPSKRKTEISGPDPKKSCIAADFKLPPFNPKAPLGKEFVTRKWGYFCNLCSVCYLNESTKEDQHCKSQMHQENLQKYHQRRMKLKPYRVPKQS